MDATTTPPEVPPGPRSELVLAPRFDGVERAVHWLNAALFIMCMLTGAVLYIGQLSAIVGNREIVRTVHVYAGLAIPVAFLLGWAPPWGSALQRDLRRLNRWQAHDSRWFSPRRRARNPTPEAKFNAGQKLNTAFVFGAGVVMLGTGAIMRWYEHFPLDWRTGATFVHDWFALFLWIDVIAHITFALRDQDAMRAMLRGGVSYSSSHGSSPSDGS